MSRGTPQSESGITYALTVGIELAGGWRTMAIKAGSGMGFGASLAPAPTAPGERVGSLPGVGYNAAMLNSRLVMTCVMSVVAARAAAPDCDRACLRNALDQYLNAVVKHDPAAAPLSVGFRQTDNAVVVRPGTGVWKTVTGLGKLQRRYLDAVSGQAGYFGVVEEGNEPAIVTVRLKVEQRKITEAEWLIARKGDPGLNGPPAPGQPAGNFFDPENLTANPPPERTLAKEARVSREALMAITNSYFDGITTHDGSIIMAHEGCVRVENGRTVTGRNAGPGGGQPVGGSDCTSNLATINIQNVVARRYPVLDEEAGVALAIAVFIRKPGTTNAAQRAERMVCDRQGQDPQHLFGDVLSAAGSAGAELAAVRRQLAAAGELGGPYCTVSLTGSSISCPFLV